MRFQIIYTDPETGITCRVEREYNDSPAVPGVHGSVSAWDWAHDEGYALADKGPYTVEKL